MSKNDKSEEEAYSRIISYMNDHRKDCLYIFAWNLFNFSVEGMKSVSMQTINSNSFTLSIQTSKGKIEKTHKFNPPLLSAQESRDRLMKLYNQLSIARWPRGIPPFIALGLWLSMLFSLVQAKELLTFQIVKNVQSLTLKIYGTPSNAAMALVLLIAIHTFETAYAMYNLRNIPFSAKAKRSWMSLTFLLGYPMLIQTIALSKTVSSKSVKAD